MFIQVKHKYSQFMEAATVNCKQVVLFWGQSQTRIVYQDHQYSPKEDRKTYYVYDYNHCVLGC